MSTQQLQIPVVTEHDLRLFHDKHFSSFKAGASNRHTDVNLEENDGDDDLGYYADGVKRTLTDDQIAMFRHSEIQTLLRERRRRRENSEGETSHDASTESIQPVGNIRPPSTADDTVRQRSASTSGSQGVGKRKWQRFIESSGTNPEHLTHRRIARELDEQKASSIDLAYGDEEESLYQTATEKRPEAISGTQDRRKPVSYEGVKGSAPAKPPSGASYDSKFIWPTLGAKQGGSGD